MKTNKFITKLGYAFCIFGAFLCVAYAIAPSQRQNMEKRISMEQEKQVEANNKANSLRSERSVLDKRIKEIDAEINDLKSQYSESKGIIQGFTELLETYEYDDELNKAYQEGLVKE